MADRTTKVTLVAQVNGYVAGMEKSAKATRKMSKDSSEALAQQKESFEMMGRASLTAGALALAGAGLAAKAAVDWETAWTGVTKTVEGTPEQLAAIEDGLRGLARELPTTHAEIAAVAEAAGQLGIQSENVVEFTRTMIDLGQTTSLSAEEAATSLARFSNVMGTSQDDVGLLGSALVGLGNTLAANETEILNMASRLSGAGEQAKFTEGSVLGLAAAMVQVGINAEAGGTAMTMTMQRITKEVELSGDKLELFASIAGMTSKEFSTAWKDDAAGALSEFVTGLGKAEEAGTSTTVVLEELGITGQRESQALLKLSSNADKMTAAMEAGNEEYEAGNALQEEAAKRYDTTAAKLNVAKNGVIDAAVSFGETFLPAISAAADGVSEFTELIGGLPKPLNDTLNVVVVLGGAAAVAGGAFLLAVPKVVAYRAAIETMGTAAKRTSRIVTVSAGLIGVAFVAAAAAFAVFSGAQADAKERTQGFIDTLDEQSGKVTEAAREMVIASLTTEASGGFDSAADSAERLGISLELVTDAALSDAEAMAQLKDKLVLGAEGSELLKQQMDETGLSSIELYAATKNVEDSVGGLTDAQIEAVRVIKQKTDADGGAADAAEVHKESLDELAGGAAETQTEIAKLSDEIRNFGTTTFNVIDAEQAFEESLRDLEVQMVDGYKGGLDLATEAGNKNMDTLQAMAKSTNEFAAAAADAGADQEEVNGILTEGKVNLEAAATAFDGAEGAAAKYGDKLIALPEVVNQSIAIETEEADRRIAAFRARWSGPIKTRVHPFAYDYGRADGGEINGVGGPRQDNIPIMASVGEHMFDAEDVNRMGGQAAVYKFRESLYKGASMDASQYASAPIAVPQSVTESSTRGGAQRSQSVPVALTDSTIEKLGRVTAGHVRNQNRKG